MTSLSRAGAAIVVLAVTLTIWNGISWWSSFASMNRCLANNTTFSGFLSDSDRNACAAYWHRDAPVYAQREVLILGVGLAAWLLVGRSRQHA
jgi:hypothetical protein